jgi:hypothetical protein
MSTETPTLRQITDEQGRTWQVVKDEATVAHRRKGARLAFRLADEAAPALLVTPIEFNSDAAADLAIRTMGEHELKRRLQWAKTDAGVR